MERQRYERLKVRLLSAGVRLSRGHGPGLYLRGRVAPLVLALAFCNRDTSPRWKEIVEPYRGRFMHHPELYSTGDLDDEVVTWLRNAWIQAV